MKLHRRIAAGTALALLMGTAQLGAAPLLARFGTPEPAGNTAGPAPLILAQARECPADDPDCDEREAPAEQPAQQAPAEAPAAEETPAPEPQAEQPPAPAEPRPAQEAPADQPAPQAPAEEPATDEAPAQDEAPAVQPPAEQPAAPAEQPPAATEPAPAEQAPADEQPAPQAPAEEPATDEAPAQGEAPAVQPPAEQPAAPAGQPPAATEQPPAEQAPAEQPAPQAPTEQPAAGEAAPQGETPAVQQPAGQAPAEQAPAGQAPGEQPAQPGAPGADAASPLPENAAPVLDSQKEQQAAPDGEAQPGTTGQPAEQPPRDQAQPAEPAAPPPESDAAAQQQAEPVEVESLTAERGERIDVERVRERRERHEGGEVLREIGDRIVLQFGNQIIVESNDRERLRGDARDVYYEELPRGRTREVITRRNGAQVVTIRDRYGDIIRRSRITPDGREIVLVYADRRGDREGRREFYDPGRDLPPLRLTIPVEEYILDAERVEDPDVYYRFLDQPPVEQVQRLYSIDEVKYSARVRDSVRRIDLDTVTFEFGSAAIAESEIPRLEGVATAMERLLEENPAETFLIEGHTDAVGSDVANLALSDQRAEAVATALSNVFAIPPENLVTQGYGEAYLKIDTQQPERENRRVAIRRITPLVAPVASAN